MRDKNPSLRDTISHSLSCIFKKLHSLGQGFSGLWSLGCRHPWSLWLTLGILINFTAPYYENILDFFATKSQLAKVQKASQTVKTIEGHILRCHDGDTCVVQPKDLGPTFKVRLLGIDAPEVSWAGKAGQVFGSESQKHLEGLLLKQNLKIEIQGTDRYGRFLARLYRLKDGTHLEEINRLMAEDGYAYAYRNNRQAARENASYVEAENLAHEKKLGFWALSHQPDLPWEHRHASR